MIFHENKCIYIHVPKSGGTSIMKAFGLNWHNPDSLRMNPDTHRGNHPYNDLDSLPAYFRFSTVRNPFDRFISGWKYCGFTKNRTLLDVIANLPKRQIVVEQKNLETEDFAYHHIAVTQKELLVDATGKLAPQLLIRYENLQPGFDQVCDVVGKPRCVLPHENATSRAAYRHYFDAEPEARRIAEQYFREDLEFFGYDY